MYPNPQQPPGYPPVGQPPGYPPVGQIPSYPPVGQPYGQPGAQAYYQQGYPPVAMQPGMYAPQAGQPAVYYQTQPGAVQMQPGMAQTAARGQPMPWMARPAVIPGCPPGLEYLTQVDQLLVHQLVEMLEVLTGWETCNRYRVFNSMGQQAYYAFEESDFCQRMCCGTLREYTIHIVDNANQEVMRVFRPFKCSCGGCFGCCLPCQQEIQIEAPPGVPIGYAIQECFCCNPSFIVLDGTRKPVFRIDGPCTFCPRCPCDYDFNILSIGGGAKVGKITKQWSGFAQEAFTDADNFGISFPLDLDVRLKATLLGVLFLIDFMFFETSGNQNNNRSTFY